jgi:hypothetical protein
MTDAERIAQLEAEVDELKDKVDFLMRQSGLSDDEIREFRHRTTMPAPPPFGVGEDGAGLGLYSEPTG